MGAQFPPQPAAPAIDSCFIIPEEHRPKTAHNEYISSTGEEVPVIDLEHLRSEDNGRRSRAIAAIGDACEHWGFFQVSDSKGPRCNILFCSEKLERLLVLIKNLESAEC